MATLVLIMIYVLMRFTSKLAVGAILAVLHDPICVLGFFALTQITFDLTAISAILAVIGYSLNDTVIVFDRVRERARNARKLPIAQVIDESINQTLSRTLMTKLVTLLVVVSLLIFGGETLHGFSAALVIGIIAGTYSSIYISAAIALDLGLRTDDLLERKLTRPEEVDGLPVSGDAARSAGVALIPDAGGARDRPRHRQHLLLSVLVERLPPRRARSARFLGSGFAMLTRIGLLLSVVWITKLRRAALHVMGRPRSRCATPCCSGAACCSSCRAWRRSMIS